MVRSGCQFLWNQGGPVTGSCQFVWNSGSVLTDELIVSLPDSTLEVELPDSTLPVSLPDTTLTLDPEVESMQRIVRVRGDAGPSLVLTIKQNGSVVDLSGAGVIATARMRLIGASVDKYSAACTNLTAAGLCTMPFTAASLNAAGEYKCEVYITGLAGGSQTLKGYFIIEVRDSNAA